MNNQINRVFVVGPFRSGTSSVAGAMEALGVQMGTTNKKGFVECDLYTEICRSSFVEHTGEQVEDYETISDDLYYAMERRENRAPYSKHIGAKHPSFCRMVNIISDNWLDALFISTKRPIEDSIKSMKRLKWKPWSSAEIDKTMRDMLKVRDAELAKIDPSRKLEIEIYGDPTENVNRLIRFLGLTPSMESKTLAVRRISNEKS